MMLAGVPDLELAGVPDLELAGVPDLMRAEATGQTGRKA